MATYFYTASSLDGFIATTDHSLEWLFKQDFDWEATMPETQFMAGVGALVMGSSTYQWLLRNQESWEYTQPAWVFTHRDLDVLEAADVRFVQGDPADAFDRIAASADGKNVWVMGGGDLAAQFAEANLLDEGWIQIAPVMLGSGQPLFTRPLQLDLLNVVRNRDFACTRYRVHK
ncbi:dihydrofolate reductase family protein [Galactobacter sp.]|uniref:dihydrofolate reductase family protein n=1 Tax=Galactobacter sp. TaxID=2676125 RepID=UPI0025BF31CE|nr:dihydrofolate reductase family protein [Galactobacter sp.]